MLKIYTDGACSGNTGPGGWAFVIPDLDVELSGFESNTTNNRMEVTAVFEALKYLYTNWIEKCDDVEIITDSQYVVNTMTKGWKKQKNTDLWSMLEYYLFYFSNVKWTWVKGHADNEYNRKCDELAVREYKNYQEYHKKEIEKEQQRELEWYGRKVPLDTKQKTTVEFVPYEKYDVGKDNYVVLLKCTALESVFAAEADNKELLCIGSYLQCRQVLQNYKGLVEDNFRKIPF